MHSIELDAEDDTGTVGDGITSQKEDLTFGGSSLPGSTVRLLYKGQDPDRNDVWTAFGLTPNVAISVADTEGNWTISDVIFNDHAASYVEEIGIRVTPAGETAFINPEETALIDFSIQKPIYSIELDAEDDTDIVGDGITSHKENLTFGGSSLPGSTVRLLYKGQDPDRNDVWTAFGLTPNVAISVADTEGNWTISDVIFNDHAASYVEEIGIRVTPAGETAFINPEETALIDFSIQKPIYSIELDSEDDTGTAGDGITAQKEDLTFSGSSLPGSTVRLLYKGQDPDRSDVWTAFGLTPNIATAVTDTEGNWTISDVTFNDHAASYVEEIGIRVTPAGETAFINPEETALIDFSIQRPIYSIELDAKDDTDIAGDGITLQKNDLTFNGTSVPEATVQLFYYNGSIWTTSGTTLNPVMDIVDKDGNWSIDVSFNDAAANVVERIGIRTTEIDGTVTNPYKKGSPSSIEFKIDTNILGVPNIESFVSSVIPELNQIVVSTAGTTSGFVTKYTINETDITIILNDSTNHVSSSLELEGFAPGVLSSTDPNITKIKFQDWRSDIEAKEVGKVFFDVDALVIRAAETDNLLSTRVKRWSLLLNENSDISITASLETDTDLFLYRTLSTNSFDGTIDGTVNDDVSEVHFFDENDNHIHTETVFQNNWSFDLENLITTVGLQDSYTLQLKTKDIYENLSDDGSEISFVVDVIAPSVEYYEKLSDDLFMIRMSEDLFNIAYKETVNTGFSVSDLSGLNIYDPIAISILEDTILLFFPENTSLPEEGVVSYIQTNDIEIKDLSGNIYTEVSTQQYIDSTKGANVLLGKLNYLKNIYAPFSFSEEPKMDVLIEVNNLPEVELVLKANNILGHKILENLDLIFASIDEDTLSALNSSAYVDMIFENKENQINQTRVPINLNRSISSLSTFINNSNYQGEDTVVAVVDTGIKSNAAAFTPIIVDKTTGKTVPRIVYEACHSFETDSDAIVEHITDEIVDDLSHTDFVQVFSRYGFLGSLISIRLKPVFYIPGDSTRDKVRESVESSLHEFGINFYEGLCDSGCTYANGCEHGTHVASVISGETDSNNSYYPVAPKSQLAIFQADSRFISGSCKTNGTCRSIFPSVSILEAINDIIEQKKNGLNIVAANFSLGGRGFEGKNECSFSANSQSVYVVVPDLYNGHVDVPAVLLGRESSSAYRSALEKLYNTNIIPIFASGNSYARNQIATPACIFSENVVAGSLNSSLSAIADHSNIAESIDFVAPGRSVKVVGENGNYSSVSGTSFAAPYVAGSFAILRSKYPDASINQLINRLKSHSVFFSDTRSGAVHTSPIFPYPYNPAGAAEGPISNIVVADSAGDILTVNTSTKMYETDEAGIMVFIKTDSNLAKITVENEDFNRLNTIKDITTSHQTEPYILVDTIPLKSAYINPTEVFTVQVEVLDTLSSNPNDFVKYTNEIIKINKTNPFTLLEADEYTTYPLDDYVLSKNEMDQDPGIDLLRFANGTDTTNYEYALTHTGNCNSNLSFKDDVPKTNDSFFEGIAISETVSVLCVKIGNSYRPINFDIYLQLEFKNEIKKIVRDKAISIKFQSNVTGTFNVLGSCLALDSDITVEAGVTRGVLIVDREGNGSALKSKKYSDCEIEITSNNNTDSKKFAIPTFLVPLKTLAVGANYDNDGGIYKGAVYIFEKDLSGVWSQTLKISDNGGGDGLLNISLDDGDQFGISTSYSGNLLAVGAERDDDGGDNRGAVYIFEKDLSGAWSQTLKISDNGGGSGLLDVDLGLNNHFGSSVSILDNTLVVGVRDDDDGGANKGAIYIFEKDSNGVWSQTLKISDNGGDGANGKLGINLDNYDNFGSDISYSDATLVAGVYRDNDGGVYKGAVYIFEKDSNGVWSQTLKISNNGGGDGLLNINLDNDYDEFGASVSYSDDQLFVGARKDDDGGTNRGVVYIFEKDSNGVWSQTLKISDNGGGDGKVDIDLSNQDSFGYSVSYFDGQLAVGASGDDDGGNNQGAVYIFEQNLIKEWSQTLKISDNGGGDGKLHIDFDLDNDGFGSAVGGF